MTIKRAHTCSGSFQNAPLIVPGGGVALARCATALNRLKLEGDEQIGVNIVKRALQEPLRQIAENAGEEGAIELGKVLESKTRTSATTP